MATRYKYTLKDKDLGWRKLSAQLKASKSTAHAAIGILQKDAGAAYEGGATVLEIATIHEFGLGKNPERSFIRATFDNSRSIRTIIRNRAFKVLQGSITHARALKEVGEWGRSKIVQRINRGIPPPNAPATIARKGSSKTLVDTGRLKGTIASEVRGL